MKRLMLHIIICVYLFQGVAFSATAITTRSEKGSALTWAEMDANFTALRDSVDNGYSVISAQIAAVMAGQAGGTLGYTTKTAMDADLAHAAGTLAKVTNDATGSNNGNYIKLGASGAGSWQKSAYQDQPFVDAALYGYDLNAAVSARGSTPTTLIYASDLTVSANITIPATFELMPINGAVIDHTTYTISYAGPVERWPVTQIFNGTGLVTLIKSMPEWFGVTGTNDDVPINKAVNAARYVKLSNTIYNLGASVIMKNGTSFEGVGRSYYPASQGFGSVLHMTGTGPGIAMDTSHGSVLTYLEIKNLTIVGNNSDTSTGDGINLSHVYGLQYLNIDNVRIVSAGRYGIYGAFTDPSRFVVNTKITNSQIGEISQAAKQPVSDCIHIEGRLAESLIENNQLYSYGGHGIYITPQGADTGPLQDNYIVRNSVSGNATGDDIHLVNFIGGGVIGNHMERATGGTASALYLNQTNTTGGGMIVSGNFFEGSTNFVTAAGYTGGVSVVSNAFFWNGSTPASQPTVINIDGANTGYIYRMSNKLSSNISYSTHQKINGYDGATGDLRLQIISSAGSTPLFIDGIVRPATAAGYNALRMRTLAADGATYIERFKVSNAVSGTNDRATATFTNTAINIGAVADTSSPYIPNSSLYVDSADGVLKFKDSAGSVHSLY